MKRAVAARRRVHDHLLVESNASSERSGSRNRATSRPCQKCRFLRCRLIAGFGCPPRVLINTRQSHCPEAIECSSQSNSSICSMECQARSPSRGFVGTKHDAGYASPNQTSRPYGQAASPSTATRMGLPALHLSSVIRHDRRCQATASGASGSARHGRVLGHRRR
jgi:hypothetical protein